jgi:hypothetical protein
MTDSMELAREIVRCGVDHLDKAVAAYEKVMLPRGRDFIKRCVASGKFMFALDSPKGFQELLESYKNGNLLSEDGVKSVPTVAEKFTASE